MGTSQTRAYAMPGRAEPEGYWLAVEVDGSYPDGPQCTHLPSVTRVTPGGLEGPFCHSQETCYSV